ncbi:sialidase family protein [Paenibacillus sp. HJGM_3]|uniref:sialidase family protein n=1 Tax=Paenibacillus sp. HJGM_3 TaxID=3379816 RepID=UPI003864B2A4
MGLRKINDTVIYQDENYNSFPNAVVLPDGTLIVGFRQARDLQRLYGKVTHVDPASKAVYVTSSDGGRTWDSNASLLHDDYLRGIQDPCLNVLKDGSIFCTFFCWKAFASEDVENRLPTDHHIYDRWIGRLEGLYSIRSNNGGEQWDDPIRILGGAGAVRGNAAEFPDGSLVLATYGGNEHKERVVVMKTSDKGMSWSSLAVLEHPDYILGEPNLYLTPSGKLVAFIRTAPKAAGKSGPGTHPLITAESQDGGLTWSELAERPFFSPSPFHALRLRSGNVLVTYGYRYAPYGVRAFLLDAECNFEHAEETVLRNDGLGYDIGYTSAVQLPDDRIIVTYYYYDDSGRRVIAGTVCMEE